MSREIIKVLSINSRSKEPWKNQSLTKDLRYYTHKLHKYGFSVATWTSQDACLHFQKNAKYRVTRVIHAWETCNAIVCVKMYKLMTSVIMRRQWTPTLNMQIGLMCFSPWRDVSIDVQSRMRRKKEADLHWLMRVAGANPVRHKRCFPFVSNLC